MKENNTIIVVDDKEVTSKITQFFTDMFTSKEYVKISEIKPKAMIKPFTSEEVEIAVKSFKNNKSAGNDNIYAEQLKCSPNVMYKYISDIFNNMAEIGVFPSEIEP